MRGLVSVNYTKIATFDWFSQYVLPHLHGLQRTHPLFIVEECHVHIEPWRRRCWRPCCAWNFDIHLNSTAIVHSKPRNDLVVKEKQRQKHRMYCASILGKNKVKRRESLFRSRQSKNTSLAQETHTLLTRDSTLKVLLIVCSYPWEQRKRSVKSRIQRFIFATSEELQPVLYHRKRKGRCKTEVGISMSAQNFLFFF